MHCTDCLIIMYYVVCFIFKCICTYLFSLSLSRLFSVSVNLLVTKPYINIEYLRCNPSDTTQCYLVNFKFNNSIINTSSEKYELTNTTFPVILRVLNIGPSDAGIYQCTFKCSGIDITSSGVYLPFVCKSMYQTP